MKTNRWSSLTTCQLAYNFPNYRGPTSSPVGLWGKRLVGLLVLDMIRTGRFLGTTKARLFFCEKFDDPKNFFFVSFVSGYFYKRNFVVIYLAGRRCRFFFRTSRLCASTCSSRFVSTRWRPRPLPQRCGKKRVFDGVG